jgi:hypothetical protein
VKKLRKVQKQTQEIKIHKICKNIKRKIADELKRKKQFIVYRSKKKLIYKQSSGKKEKIVIKKIIKTKLRTRKH